MGVDAIFGGNRYLVPFNRGIATPVCGLVRNDRKLEGEAINTNLSSWVSSPVSQIHRPVLDGLGDVLGLDFFAAV